MDVLGQTARMMEALASYENPFTKDMVFELHYRGKIHRAAVGYDELLYSYNAAEYAGLVVERLSKASGVPMNIVAGLIYRAAAQEYLRMKVYGVRERNPPAPPVSTPESEPEPEPEPEPMPLPKAVALGKSCRCPLCRVVAWFRGDR